MKSTPQERRVNKRYSCDWPATVKADSHEMDGFRIHNISLGGALVRGRSLLYSNDVEFHFPIGASGTGGSSSEGDANHPKHITTQGRIVPHSESHPGGVSAASYDFGIQFLELDLGSRILLQKYFEAVHWDPVEELRRQLEVNGAKSQASFVPVQDFKEITTPFHTYVSQLRVNLLDAHTLLEGEEVSDDYRNQILKDLRDSYEQDFLVRLRIFLGQLLGILEVMPSIQREYHQLFLQDMFRPYFKNASFFDESLHKMFELSDPMAGVSLNNLIHIA